MAIYNKFNFVLVLLIATIFLNSGVSEAKVCVAEAEKPFSYNSNLANGPEHWGGKYPTCSEGLFQSPINIVPEDAIEDENLKDLKLNNYDKKITKVRIENIGYTVQIFPKDGVERSIEVDGSKYVLEFFELCWGTSNERGGSDHTIDSKQFAMEIEFTHRNEENEVLMVSQFLEATPFENSEIRHILEKFDHYRYEGTAFEGRITHSADPSGTVVIPMDIVIESLIGYGPYYRYTGSVTFPPCNEDVLWIIRKNIGNISVPQLEKLSELSLTTKQKDAKECRLKYNYRPIQELNGRKVYSST